MAKTVYPTPDVVVRARARVGEGPVWDHRTGRLCWVDIDNGLLFENDLAAGSQHQHETRTLLGAAAPRASQPGFAVAVADGLGLLTEDDGVSVLDPVLPEPYRRMNDAKCDSHGRLWAGSTHIDFQPGMGALHHWDGTGPSSVVADGFTLPNGLGWDADDSVMYLADTMRHVLLRTSYSGDDGVVGEFTELATIDGLPDGLAVDVDGCVWLAIWGGYEVRRYDPTGRLVGQIPMPVAKPSSCAFGADGALYITSAAADLSEQQLRDQPLAGSIFVVNVGVAGVPVAPFAG